jgi:hypothetical protein
MAGGRLFGLCFLAEVCRFRAPFPSEVGTAILIESQHLEKGVESISVHFFSKASLAAMGTKLDFAIIDFGPKGKQCIVNLSLAKIKICFKIKQMSSRSCLDFWV